jgi:hypothetical protein
MRATTAGTAVHPEWIATSGMALATGTLIAGVVLGSPVAGIVAAAIVCGAAGAASLRAVRSRLAKLSPEDTLDDLGRALADALSATGLAAPSLGADAVRIFHQPDGYYRCFLDGASSPEAARFAEALEELVSPLWDPRWIIPRRVESPPADLAATLGVVARGFLAGGRVAPAVWHAVPQALAGRRDRVAAFETAWSSWVSPGASAIAAGDPRAEAILALRTGDDPFRVETELRTLWT